MKIISLSLGSHLKVHLVQQAAFNELSKKAGGCVWLARSRYRTKDGPSRPLEISPHSFENSQDKMVG